MFKKFKDSSKEEYWAKHISKHKQTDLSQKEYCKLNNLVYDTFRAWRRKLNKLNQDEIIKVPSEITNSMKSSDNSLEIIINQGVKIKVTKNYNQKLLKDVLRSLGVPQ